MRTGRLVITAFLACLGLTTYQAVSLVLTEKHLRREIEFARECRVQLEDQERRLYTMRDMWRQCELVKSECCR